MNEYRPRLLDTVLAGRLAQHPTLVITGAPGCGKSTTAARYTRSVIRMDATRAGSLGANPSALLEGREEPIHLESRQSLAEVAGAATRTAVAEHSTGRLVITGSARSEILDEHLLGAHDIAVLEMYPLTIAEQLELPPPRFIDRVLTGELLAPSGNPQLGPDDYIRLALRGGFPESALEADEADARQWLKDYAERIISRHVQTVTEVPRRVDFRRYVRQYALHSADIGGEGDPSSQQAVLWPADYLLSRKSLVACERYLRDLMVVDWLPAWRTKRPRRLSLSPKQFVIDAGLLAAMLGVEEKDVLARDVLRRKVIDTFVMAQLRAEVANVRPRYRLSHLRDHSGRRKVDVIVELPDRGIVGINIVATSNVRDSDARDLQWLKETIGRPFVAGIVLHTGPSTLRLPGGMVAAPISALWE
ncbi:MAG: DUF4143 domain-containing protein [bacterium]|nr:DUF4143 domain-containing protein [bacterium]